jgi:UDP-N-acetylglucosamine 2-epimerase (non-hydrolysing)
MPNFNLLSRPDIFKQAVASANEERRSLFIVCLATKPCYIKLASLVIALRRRKLPFLLLDTGQHYDPVLTSAGREFAYEHLIAASFHIRGGLLERTADLAEKLQWLATELHSAGLRQSPIPIVSGDTSTAALLPIFWYLLTGCRSVHVEAGLRSLGPPTKWQWEGLDHLLTQRSASWSRVRDEPFPESIDTTLASVASDLLLAPVQINSENLLREGYDAEQIRVVGSLSADAVELALGNEDLDPSSRIAADLSGGPWLRVDIHRRENTTPARLEAILRGVSMLSQQGCRILFIMTNAMRSALAHSEMKALLDNARRHGVVIQDLWPSYLDVVRFMRSSSCLAIFTDSGGLQEEANVLGVPCITCRFSTDRPETVLDAATNILVPPANQELISRALEALLSAPPEKVWPGLKTRKLYQTSVGERIANILANYSPPHAAAGAEFIF